MEGGLVALAVRRSPPTAGGPEFASRSLHVGFVVDETGSGQVFLGVPPVFPYHTFHSTISSHSSHPFRFISPALVMVRQTWSAGTLATHGPILWGSIASHPSIRPCVGHELRIFIYYIYIYIFFFLPFQLSPTIVKRMALISLTPCILILKISQTILSLLLRHNLFT